MMRAALRLVALGSALLASTAAERVAAAQVPSPPASAATPAPAPAQAPAEGAFTEDQAIAIALRRNLEVISARFAIEEAQVERVAAGIYPNPVLSYTAGNVVVGTGNPQNEGLKPGPFSQLVQSIGVSEVIDVWAKRGARMHAADLGIEQQRLLVEDVLREIVLSVRAAFTDVVREQAEYQAVSGIKTHYDETSRLARARVRAGEISEAEGAKIELEGLKYQNAVIDAQMELDLARRKLATLLAFASPADLPGTAVGSDTGAPRTLPLLEPLLAQALRERPDLLAARKSQEVAEAELGAARREGYPDPSIGLTYTHSEFAVSGDNPDSLAITLAIPLPLFDRNQAGVARARLDAKRSESDVRRAELRIRQDVAEAARRVQRAAAVLDVYEGGGMLDRAERALKVAEASYKAGSISLLELLEAQRTFIETRMQYLESQDDYRKALAEVKHAVGEKLQ
ncbi:MAG TPA: TolC family protein [Polyangiaceae bacterium]|nr:TolC family protein [Polyangiaceae bacterium]